MQITLLEVGGGGGGEYGGNNNGQFCTLIFIAIYYFGLSKAQLLLNLIRKIEIIPRK